tara:strand:+ start:11215 stop:11367 length:153 start_codon:yes stop_codon:yes gene_type:complete
VHLFGGQQEFQIRDFQTTRSGKKIKKLLEILRAAKGIELNLIPSFLLRKM